MAGLIPQIATLKSPQDRIDAMRFTCDCCDKSERGPRALIKLMPDPIYALPEDERVVRAKISTDLAILDAERFFIRGVVRVPIRRVDPPFEFGVWAEVAKPDFRLYLAEYDNN